MKRVIAIAFAGIVGLTAVGCTTNELETRREATTAALSNYPGNAQESAKYKLAAVDDQNQDTLTILNLTDETIAPGTIWVNGRYVKKISSIPAQSSVTVAYNELLEGGGGVMDLSKADSEQIQKVELQTHEGLFTVMGPSRK